MSDLWQDEGFGSGSGSGLDEGFGDDDWDEGRESLETDLEEGLFDPEDDESGWDEDGDDEL